MHALMPAFPFLRALFLVSSLVSAALSHGGCSGGPQVVKTDLPPFDPLATPPYGMAQVCIIRPHTWAFLHTIPIEDNGQLVGATLGPSFFCYLAQPGTHRIRMPEEKNPPLVLQLVAGQRAYLHLRVRITRISLHLIQTEEAELLQLLDKCEYSTLLDWRGREIAAEAYAEPRNAAHEPRERPATNLEATP